LYDILLVDDEKIELEALEQYMPWHSMGLSVAGTARNGKEALEQMKLLQPHIIITDVRMPVMDGLEFARRAKQLDPNVKIIFLSGHNEFQYIKSALNLEASGYLLKPVDPIELSETMDKMKSRLDSEALLAHSAASMYEGVLFKLLHVPSHQLRQELAAELRLIQPSLQLEGILAVSYLSFNPLLEEAQQSQLLADPRFILPREQTNPRVHNTWVKVPPHAWVVVHQLSVHTNLRSELLTFWESWQQQCHANGKPTAPIGISSLGSGYLKLEDLYQRYEESKAAAEELFFAGEEAILFYDELPQTSTAIPLIEPLIKELDISITKGNSEAAKEHIVRFFQQAHQEHVLPRLIRSSTVHILSTLEQQFSSVIGHSQPELLMIDHWKSIAELRTLEAVSAYLTDYCLRLGTIIGAKEGDRNALVVQKIMDYIQEHFAKALTVEQIAQHVYLSPNYVRSLFKEKTGETILNYMTQLRMQKAIQLLKQPKLKIHEISVAVGYENTSYFISVFQKHEGCTPAEYRNSRRY